MNEFKGTPGPWIADIRGGCAAIYPASCIDDTPGCHNGDSRNIAYSDKGAKFNGVRWEIDASVEHDFKLMAASPELLDALQDMLSGWKYIREKHGDLYGVGWDRAQNKAIEAISKALGESQ